MNTIVIYRSKYGHVKRYAEMIAKELNCNFVDIKGIKKSEMLQYDKVIFGTGVYMGKMRKLGKMKQIFSNKPIIFYACGGNNNIEHEIDVIKESNFTKEELEFHKFFYLPGGMDISMVKGPMKLMFKFIAKVLEKKKDKTHDEEEFLRGLKHPEDLVDKKHITNLLEYVKTA